MCDVKTGVDDEMKASDGEREKEDGATTDSTTTTTTTTTPKRAAETMKAEKQML